MNNINFYNETIIALFLCSAVSNAMETKVIEINRERENKKEQKSAEQSMWERINEASREDKPMSRAMCRAFNNAQMSKAMREKNIGKNG